MMVLRRAGVVLMIAVLGLGLGSAVAGAKKKHQKPKGHVWGSNVTLTHPSANRFTGIVHSGLAACFQGRLVNVFYTDPSSGQRALLSVQRTNNKGRYEVDLTQQAYPGIYQAQAAKLRTRFRKMPQTCRARKSKNFGI
jgi:hypothetical protein